MKKKIAIIVFISLFIFATFIFWYVNFNILQRETSAKNLVNIEDMDGRLVKIPEKINRTVVLSGGVVELMCIWGIGNKLVGTTSFIKNHPVIGKLIGNNNVTDVGFSSSNIDVEKIISLKPDLVIAYNPKFYGSSTYKNEIQQIENKGIPVIYIYVRSLPEFYKLILLIGRIFNLTTPANSTISYVQSLMNLVKNESSNIPESKRVKVLFLYGSPTVVQTVQGDASFINDLIENAGGENVIKNSGQEFVKASFKDIASWNPDVIVIWSYPSEFSPEYLMNISDLSNVSAIKYGRVYKQPESLDGSIWTIRSALFDAWLLKVFYKNTSINFTKIANDFSRRFYNFSLDINF
ncbi:MAG: helical backbone metal receptor [Thermoproteota archaeon]|nr:ABC transporter substrate-binding protein [Candidatus Brockarchaeota archaeon]